MTAQNQLREALPEITDEDREFLHYNPNTADLVEWVQSYATRAIALSQPAAASPSDGEQPTLPLSAEHLAKVTRCAEKHLATPVPEAGAGDVQEAVGEFMGMRSTPEGTREFWGIGDLHHVPIGSKLYTTPPAPDHTEQSLEMVATQDEVLALAGALEVRRILEEIKKVAEIYPADDMPTPFQSAWQGCCQEIFHRATGGAWHMDEDAEKFKHNRPSQP